MANVSRAKIPDMKREVSSKVGRLHPEGGKFSSQFSNGHLHPSQTPTVKSPSIKEQVDSGKSRVEYQMESQVASPSPGRVLSHPFEEVVWDLAQIPARTELKVKSFIVCKSGEGGGGWGEGWRRGRVGGGVRG